MRSTAKYFVFVLIAALVCSVFAFTACGEITLSSIETECTVTEYTEGDDFDIASVTVTAVYSDGSKRTVSGWKVEDGDSLTVGKTSVTVSYTEDGVTVNANIAITVTAKPHVHDFESAGWQTDGEKHWKQCACGEKSEEAAHEWKDKTDVTEDVSCTQDGKEIVTCKVCGYSTSRTIEALGHDFSVPLYDETNHWNKCSRCDETDTPAPHDLTLSVSGFKTEYFEGEKVTLEGATAGVSCECGFAATVDSSQLSAPDKTLTLEDDGATLNITYNGLSFGFTVTVKERTLNSIAVKDGYKSEYAIGESFAGGTLVLGYDDGGSKEIPLTEDMLSGFDTSSAGEKEVTVTYDGLTTKFTVRVGYDEVSGAYRLGSELNTEYKVQAENADYVDMSQAVLQTGTATNKFENEAKNSANEKYPNGAEGYSTCNISVKGNKIILRFFSDKAGVFHIGMRGQSGSFGGLQDQALDKAFALNVNGIAVTPTGTLRKGSATDTKWCDMTLWTELDDITGNVYAAKGLNEVTFAYLGETGDLRLPNIDYFTVTFTEFYDNPSITVAGSAEIPVGGSYTEGLTLTYKNGDTVIKENVPVTADMISGLDNSSAGNKTVTVNYMGVSAEYEIEVIDEKHTLTLVGGTLEGGGTTAELGYGETLPDITWDDEANILGWSFGNDILTDLSGVTMGAEDITLRAITVSECNNVIPGASIRQNTGMKDNSGAAIGAVNATENIAISTEGAYGESDAVKCVISTVDAKARGITFKNNTNFGSGSVIVFVAAVNDGAALQNVIYGTECGIVTLGNIGTGETARAAATITSDGNNHWTHLFWDGEISALDLTVAIYTYALA